MQRSDEMFEMGDGVVARVGDRRLPVALLLVTLWLVNGAGVATNVWVGGLQTGQESELLSALGTKKKL